MGIRLKKHFFSFTKFIIIIASFTFGYFISNLQAQQKDFESESDKSLHQSSKMVSDCKPEDKSRFKVLFCHDGDTCKVEIGGVSFNVRLADIDAPELSKRKGVSHQPFGRESAEKINELVQGKEVTLNQISTDMYNRPIVKMINSEGIDINLKMIQLGLAELYRGSRKNTPKDPSYTQAEKKAKKEKLGIWSLPQSTYMSPYDYRRANSKQVSKNSNNLKNINSK